MSKCFEPPSQLVTGSSLLSAVAENSAADSETTIDMVGREEAVKMFEKMSDGFKKLDSETDYETEDLNQFVKNLLSSTVAISESITDVLYYNGSISIEQILTEQRKNLAILIEQKVI